MVSEEPSIASGGMTAFTRRPVGQPGVHHRARLVDASADAGDDLVDGPAQVGLGAEVRVDLDQPAAALQEDAVGTVDHDLGDVGVAQEDVDRAVAQDVVADVLDDLGPVDRAQRSLGAGEHVLEGRAHPRLEVLLLHVGVVELRAELVEQLGVHLGLQLLELVLGPGPRRDVGRPRQTSPSRCPGRGPAAGQVVEGGGSRCIGRSAAAQPPSAASTGVRSVGALLAGCCREAVSQAAHVYFRLLNLRAFLSMSASASLDPVPGWRARPARRPGSRRAPGRSCSPGGRGWRSRWACRRSSRQRCRGRTRCWP